jgi:small GTP-binding protein
MAGVNVCVLGSVNVGKTSLCRSFKGEFSTEQQPTVGIDMRPIVVDGKTLVLYDTAGQEQYRASTYQHCRNAAALLFVFDITSRGSFDELSSIRQSVLEKVAGTPAVFVVGNKIDISAERQVNRDDGQRRADEWEATYHEVSARTEEGVQELFSDVARKAAPPREVPDQPILADKGAADGKCCK